MEQVDPVRIIKDDPVFMGELLTEERERKCKKAEERVKKGGRKEVQ